MSRLLSTLTETLAGTRAVTSREFQDYGIFAFDPGGAGRTVTLPTLSADLKHHRVRIYNRADAAETLTVTATHPVAGAVTVATVCLLYTSPSPRDA